MIPGTFTARELAVYTWRRIWGTSAARTPATAFLCVTALVLLLGWPQRALLTDIVPPADPARLVSWVAERALLAWILSAQVLSLLVVAFYWASAPTWSERSLSLQAYALAAPTTPLRWFMAHGTGVALALIPLPVLALPLDLVAAGTGQLATAVPPNLSALPSPGWLGPWAVAHTIAWLVTSVAAGTWAGLTWEPVTRRVATAGMALVALFAYAALMMGFMGAQSGPLGATLARTSWGRSLVLGLDPAIPIWSLVATLTVPAARAWPSPSAGGAALSLTSPVLLALLLSWGVARRVHLLRAYFQPGQPLTGSPESGFSSASVETKGGESHAS
ncbi:MAG: hypothetical protein IMX01_03360 [Limnochordaceae bacterium]|nr:hypothetical protein [Limnochordaceae bacterium]